jgi:2-polyprenyl-3-methyl-5-hydroxy-6-metoxy-1,4-benzoquinol methylase
VRAEDVREPTREETFGYPVGGRTIESPQAFADEFLPAAYEAKSLGPRGKATLELLFAHASPERRNVLDYGCAFGAFPYQLAKERPAWNVVGWEGDYSSFEIARRYFRRDNLTFERKPYNEYESFDEPRFDVISFLEVIEHVDNPGEILEAFRRALRPDGLLLVSTPNFLGYNQLVTELRASARVLLKRTPRTRIAQQLNERPRDPTTNDGHISVYSLHTLSRLLNVHGFDIMSFAFGRGTGGPVRRLFPETLVVLGRKRS